MRKKTCFEMIHDMFVLYSINYKKIPVIKQTQLTICQAN